MGLARILCQSCGNLAYTLTEAQQHASLSISGFALVECNECRGKREEREKHEADVREREQTEAFRRWLKMHNMSEDELRKLLPDWFFLEEDD